MAVRDRLVAMVLAAGVLLGMAAWSGIGPWPGIVVAMLALVAASVIYRVDDRGPQQDRADSGASRPEGADALRTGRGQ